MIIKFYNSFYLIRWINNLFSILLIFLVVFSPSIPFFYNGTILAFIISLPFIFSSNKLINRLFYLLRQKYILYIIIAPLVIAGVSIGITAFHNVFDFFIIKTLINQSITVITIVFVLAFAMKDEFTEINIHRFLWSAFLLQTISIFIALVVPEYKEFVRMLQPDSFRKMDSYRGGIRTLTIASSGFFGLGITYGLLYILYVKYLLDNRISSTLSYVVYILFCISTFFIARTGFIGMFISIVMLLFYSRDIKRLFLLFLKVLFALVLLFFMVLIFIDNETINLFYKFVMPFAFEMFVSKGGSFETTSTNTLIHMWHVGLNWDSLLVGTGRYVNSDGSYYMHTDVGYIRNILFGGVPYFLILLFHQIYLTFSFLKFSCMDYIKQNVFLFILISYMLILHLKGEVVGFALAFLSLLYFYLIPMFYYRKNLKI